MFINLKIGINWTKADSKGDSKILPETFFKGRNWQDNAPIECPVLKTMTTTDGRDKQVLFFGAKDTAQVKQLEPTIL